jgi:6,7-dimethyl-8-ribityllumazine synthase
MAKMIQGMLDAKGLKFALVVSRFNETVSERLLASAQDCLVRHGADPKGLTVVWVPGSWEIPQAVRKVASAGGSHAIIALGALIRGETPHFDVLAAEVAKGLAQTASESDIPVSFGVLTTDTVEQALDRGGAKLGNKGWDAAMAAIEMASLFRVLG